MIYPAEANLVPFLRHLVISLQPYAQANEVHLLFSANCDSMHVRYQPFLLGSDLLQLLCAMINLIPHQSEIKLSLQCDPVDGEVFLQITNTGINLLYVNGSILQPAVGFTVQALEKGTQFSLRLSSQKATASGHSAETNGQVHPIPHFYAEIRKRLHSHFTQAEKTAASLAHTYPQEAAFLQKINALIQANLADEKFDTTALCKAMAMSRTQLFRRLKPLIRQAPALYIKTIRLQRAKALLETTEYTVSEVAFKTGFQNLSHFTKVFQQRYGFLPSVCRRSRKSATNE